MWQFAQDTISKSSQNQRHKQCHAWFEEFRYQAGAALVWRKQQVDEARYGVHSYRSKSLKVFHVYLINKIFICFASNLTNNIALNDTIILGLKSHNCHVIMQRLLPVECRTFLNKTISSTIIELCTFFKHCVWGR